MSLSIPYESVGDAQMRLNSTVVLYDNEPVYITQVSPVGPDDPKPDVFRVYAQPLPYGGGIKPKRVWKDPFERGPDFMEGEDGKVDKLRKYISSRKFDLAPFPMGFMNKDGNVHYTSRAPRRQQKQGLSEGTFTDRVIASNIPRLSFGEAISSQEFVDCVMGKYPSVQEATEMLKSDAVRSVAFCRTFALSKDDDLEDLIYLYHKTEKVGFILGQQLKLTQLANCLKEALREVGVQC